MEIEYKLVVDEKKYLKDVFEHSLFKKLIIPSTEFISNMHAIYYKYINQDAFDFNFAYRVRLENDLIVATIKHSEKNENGMFVRKEFNVEVDSIVPDLSVFKDKPCWDFISKYISLDEAKNASFFIPHVETIFTRKGFRAMIGKSEVEFAYDVGKIVANNKSVSINEIEIELIKGDINEVSKFVEFLSNKLELKPLNVSKYKRGLDLY